MNEELTRVTPADETPAVETADEVVEAADTPVEISDPGETVTEAPEKKLSWLEKRRQKKDLKEKRWLNDVFNKVDIKYRGPLSPSLLKFLGWTCIVLSQVQIIETMKQQRFGNGNPFFLDEGIMTVIDSLALPLLLISIFAILFNRRGEYKNTIITYVSLSAALFALFIFIYERYIIGVLEPLSGGREESAAAFQQFLNEIPGYHGYIAFNIFIDVLLCTLTMFFMDYTPTRFFTGKKLMLFRALVIFPIAYEVFCIVIKVLATDRAITLPIWVSPLLTTKPPLSFLMFISLIRFVKIREKMFLNQGRSLAEYHSFLHSNRNSLHFSRHLILIIVVYSLVDLGLLIVFAAMHVVIIGVSVMQGMKEAMAWGFGMTGNMIFLIPIMLLFSYTRNSKIPFINIAIPLAGVVVIILCYIDGLFQMLTSSLGDLVEMMNEYSDLLVLIE